MKSGCNNFIFSCAYKLTILLNFVQFKRMIMFVRGLRGWDPGTPLFTLQVTAIFKYTI